MMERAERPRCRDSFTSCVILIECVLVQTRSFAWSPPLSLRPICESCALDGSPHSFLASVPLPFPVSSFRCDTKRRVLFEFHEFHEFHESFRFESLKESMLLYLPLLVTIEESGWKDEKFCRIRARRSLSKRNLSTRRGNEEFHWTNIYVCSSRFKPSSRSFLSVDDFTAENR